jgi:hypothetical protein
MIDPIIGYNKALGQLFDAKSLRREGGSGNSLRFGGFASHFHSANNPNIAGGTI